MRFDTWRSKIMEKRSEQLELPLVWHKFGDHLNKPTSIKVECKVTEGYNYIFEPVSDNYHFKTAYLLTTYLPTKDAYQLNEALERHDLLIMGLAEKVERNSLSSMPLRLAEVKKVTWKDRHQETKLVFGTKSEFDRYEGDLTPIIKS